MRRLDLETKSKTKTAERLAHLLLPESYAEAAQPFLLGLVVLLAMTGACLASGVTGVLVPLTLQRFGADPAMASSIFLTAATDVVSMGLFLWLANILVL